MIRRNGARGIGGRGFVRLQDGGDLFLYVLIEHKSTPDPEIILQLLGYPLRIWRWLIGEGISVRALPPILSLVVYHGAREWNVALSLRETLAAPEVLTPHLPDFRYALVDLGPIPDLALSAYPPLRAGLLTLKYSHRDCDVKTLLVQAFTDAKDLLPLFTMLTVYVTTVYTDVDATVLRQAIRTVKPEWEGSMLSLAAREWMAEGRAEGRAEGKAEIVLRQLRRKFGTLSPEIEERVLVANSDQLDEWSERLLDARTLAKVFDPPSTH